MRNRYSFVALAPMMLVSGCLFTSGVRESDILSLESRVSSISQRIDALEASRAGSSASTSASFGASSTSLSSNVYEAAPAAAKSLARSGWWAAFTWRGAGSKLARGFTNVVTGWVEIPKRINETTNQSGALSGFTWGLVRGVGYGFIRTAGGAYEVVTFPFPAPSEYRPVMQPPYVFSRESADSYPAGS